MTEKLLSLTEAREILGVSQPTMARLLRAGAFPTVFIGRRRLVDERRLDEYIASQTRRFSPNPQAQPRR